MGMVIISEFLGGANFVTKPWLDVWVRRVMIRELLSGPKFVTKRVAGCMGEEN